MGDEKDVGQPAKALLAVPSGKRAAQIQKDPLLAGLSIVDVLLTNLSESEQFVDKSNGEHLDLVILHEAAKVGMYSPLIKTLSLICILARQDEPVICRSEADYRRDTWQLATLLRQWSRPRL